MPHSTADDSAQLFSPVTAPACFLLSRRSPPRQDCSLSGLSLEAFESVAVLHLHIFLLDP